MLLLALLPGLASADSVPYVDDAWVEISSANFQAIGNDEQSITLGVLERLERFRAAARILTGATRVDSALAMRVFVLGHGRWSHFEERPEIAGYFLTDPEANYIALDASRLDEAQGMETVLHEYVHFLSRNRGSRAHHPTWYEEGFADAISTAVIDDGKIRVGSAPAGRIEILEKEEWLPLERVVTARGISGLDSRELSLFYAESWLLVHRLTWGHVAGLKPLHEKLPDYILRVARGETESAVFATAFGMSFGRMQEELRGYLRERPPEILVDERAPAIEFEPQVRSLPRATALVLLGELQLARGENALGEAQELGRRALESDPQSPRAMLLLAGALTRQGKDPGEELVSAALALAPDDPRVVRGAANLELWRLQRLKLADVEARQAATRSRDLYSRAIELSPESPEAYAGLGRAQLALQQPAEADRSLQKAFRMARWDLRIALALAELHYRYGRPEDARRLLTEVSSSAHDDEMRTRAQQLLEGLDAKTAAH